MQHIQMMSSMNKGVTYTESFKKHPGSAMTSIKSPNAAENHPGQAAHELLMQK